MEGRPENQKAKQEMSDIDINHDSNLFDENESRSGELYDLADGKKIDNTRDESAGARLDAVRHPHEGEDALRPIKFRAAKDAKTEAWLRENDPTYKNKK